MTNMRAHPEPSVPPVRLLLPPFAASTNRLSCCWEKGWMVGAVGIEPITQSNSAAPEHRRAALLRRVCKGRHPSP